MTRHDVEFPCTVFMTMTGLFDFTDDWPLSHVRRPRVISSFELIKLDVYH